uniref:T9SS type A sorting domain-containing protein n=1 Tax=Ignavibacterium album TaxID=591197 RepID=A0A832LJS9_9BACT
MKNKFLLFLERAIFIALLVTVDTQSQIKNSQQTFELIKTIPAPGPNCQGLTWDGQYLWVSDIVNDSIYQIDTTDGTVIHKIPTTPTNHLFEGLAWDGQFLWASHYENFTLRNPRISKINPINGDVLQSIIPYSNNSWPHGITWDGTYLWISDYRTHKLIKIDPNYGFGLDSITAPGNNGNIGLAWFNGHLFMGDFNTDSIYQISPVTKEVVNQWLCPYTNPRDMEFDGQYLWFVAYEVQKIYKILLPVTSVQNEDPTLANNFILYQNYPNPFNPSTNINWQSPISGKQTIKLFDMLGREIETIVDGYYEAGNHSTLYIPNSTLSSGVYFYQLKVADTETSSGQVFVQTKKMILIK